MGTASVVVRFFFFFYLWGYNMFPCGMIYIYICVYGNLSSEGIGADC